MSTVDGRWTCTVDTPMGQQDFTLTVTSAGDRFTGSAEGGLGTMQIEDGTINGDTIAWPMRVTKPMPITLDCKATVAGDTLAGQVSAGLFGNFALKGERL